MTGIKGRSVTFQKPYPVTITFSNEDLSIAMEYTFSKENFDKVLQIRRESMTPDAIKRVKNKKFFINILEFSADRTSEYIEFIKSKKRDKLVFRLEIYPTGKVKVFIDDRLIEEYNTSSVDDRAEAFLRAIRAEVFD